MADRRSRPRPGEEPDREPTPAEEWETLAPIHHLFEVGTLASYTALRPYLLAHFGLDEHGARAAVAAMLAYYQQVRPFVFQGTSIFVHDALAERLLIAESELGDRFDLTVGGGNIRFVRGSRSVISDHSWGTAVDINSLGSPMTRGMGPKSERTKVIEAVTGVDVSLDRAGDPMGTRQRTSDELRKEAERLEQASLDLVAAFADEESLAAAAHRVASDRGAPAGGAQELLERIYAAGLGKGSEPARAGLTEFVFPSTTATQPAVGRAGRALDRRRARRDGPLVPGQGRREGQAQGPGGAFPDDGQLAAHGFMSVPPDVVAALGGKDMADLRWLGTQSGAGKDYMHFELRDEPKRY